MPCLLVTPWQGIILGLLFVDLLDNGAFVLECVSLCKHVQRVVSVVSDTQVNGAGLLQMLINLACLSVLSQQPTKDPLTTHPDHARRHPGLGSTLPLSRAGVSSLSLCSVGLTDTEAGVHDGGLLDDEAVGIELADVLARVGVADFGGLVGVEPDLAFAAVQDFRRELLLGAKIRHGWRGGGR